jgi:transcriptional regulator with XRE-family HTH domain
MKTDNFFFSRLIGERIRQVRRNKDYSQQFMADELGISQNAYSKLECGKTPIYLDRLCEVSAILSISIYDLLEEAVALIDNGKKYPGETAQSE